MPFTWTPEAERALLLTIVQQADVKPTKAMWEAVADRLGGGLTVNAVSIKFGKIKNSAATNGLLPATPVTKPKGSKANGSGSGTGKRKKADSEESTNGASDSTTNGEEAAAEDTETPSKKPKTEDGADAGGANGVAAEGE